eukprot:1789479-Prymnesium_polylepis.1
MFAELQAFSKGEINPHSPARLPKPYRNWPRLTDCLIRGGGRYRSANSGILESLFTGLTRQQGASKHHISQAQISLEARTVKNDTHLSVTPLTLQLNWKAAQRLEAALKVKSFWSVNASIAAERRDTQLLDPKAMRTVEREEGEGESSSEEEAPGTQKHSAGGSNDGSSDGSGSHSEEDESDSASEEEEEWRVEKIESHKRAKDLLKYWVKWHGFTIKQGGRTLEPEENLLTCEKLPEYWRSKKKPAEVERVLRLQQELLLQNRARN